ncbi:MAG: hypothetical protein IJQ59_03485 [Bacteroidaceae bacterium]|nr:hypothetical protein [Bacteroidaceae bacterium]
MKKTYMIPELQIVEIHSEKLIAESLDKYSGDGGSQLTKDEGDWDEVWDD